MTILATSPPLRALSVGRASLWAQQAACAAAVVVVWFVVARLGVVSGSVLPRPEEVAGALRDLVVTSDFWAATWQTLRASVIGLTVALAVAVPAGLITGAYPLGERLTRMSVDIGRSFPVVALLPVFLLIFGATQTMECTVVFAACVFPLFLQAQYGAREVTPAIRETARGYRIPSLLRFRKVVLPSAMPSIMTGLRLAASTSVLVSVGVEILSATPGLGRRLASAQLDGDAPQAFAFVFTAAVLGFLVNLVCQAAERRLLRWRVGQER
ncbi:MAG: ABC transporter permease [Nocardioides sp.]|uniref:ABC transporter permease n=1 Tax=Nocardioides sp. TaxID=35761 RepID=UPI0039E57864